jgi:hypothetical protein
MAQGFGALVKEFTANTGLTGLASNKVRHASIRRQAGGKPKISSLFSARPGNDSKRRE